MNALNKRDWRQVVWITAIALALYVGFRLLPTGTNLHHLDFRVEGRGALEFCDPANPQFVPVIEARSPVVMTLAAASDGVSAPGKETRFVLSLATSSKKPVGPEDLVLAHTRKLHLLVVDPTLRDYQHVHPEPGAKQGDWTFTLTPRLAGTYRVFADFTPLATGRSLYASADFTVAGEVAVNMNVLSWEAEQDGWHFGLAVTGGEIRVGKPADLIFTVTRADGAGADKLVPLEPVMDAYAHLVAFDTERSGFAHLHPGDPTVKLDAERPKLDFKITIPRAGIYVIWAQVKLDGRERFVPFWFEVQA